MQEVRSIVGTEKKIHLTMDIVCKKIHAQKKFVVLKGLFHIYIYVSFLIVHMKISHCSWQRTPLAIATVFPFFFFVTKPNFEPKRKEKNVL